MDENVRHKVLTAAGILVSAAALWGAPADEPVVALRLTTGVARAVDRTTATGHDRFDVRAFAGQTLVWN